MAHRYRRVVKLLIEHYRTTSGTEDTLHHLNHEASAIPGPVVHFALHTQSTELLQTVIE